MAYRNQKLFNNPTCRDCGEEIVWLKTQSGKNIAVEPESLRDGEFPKDTIYVKGVHSCHWDTCPAKVAEREKAEEAKVENSPYKPEKEEWPF